MVQYARQYYESLYNQDTLVNNNKVTRIDCLAEVPYKVIQQQN